MAFLKNINDLRKIEWGRKHLWDVKFKDAPAPFNEWFPAISIEEGLSSLESHDVQSAMTSHKVPKASRFKDIKITFYDDQAGTLREWIKKWVNTDILNGGKYLSTLESSCKPVTILKLDHKRTPISTSTYFVYPETDLMFEGDSSSDAVMYAVNFHIVSTPTDNNGSI